jgi:hypothetical protein
MSDFMMDLIDKNYELGIFDDKRCCGDKKTIKCMIEDNLRFTKKNNKKTIKNMIKNGDTLANYRYLLLELDKLDFKTIRSAINSNPTTFTTEMPECKEYTNRFSSTFPIISWDKNFHQQFFIFLFLHYGETKVSISKLIDDFYIDYEQRHGYFPNKIDFFEIAKLLHFIRKGSTALYNENYRDFFILKKIPTKMISNDSDIENNVDIEQVNRDLKKDLFKNQFQFIRAVFTEIIRNSRRNSKNSIYNYSKNFNGFENKFYITDNGVTKQKMIDYSIWYFR